MNEINIIDFVKSEIAQGKTRTEIAKELKVNRSTIYRWMHNITKPSQKSIKKFQEYLEKQYFDHVVIYGIARKLQNHDVYVPINISFCMPAGFMDERDMQKIVDDYLYAHGFVPVNFIDQSYNVVGIMGAPYFYCSKEKYLSDKDEIYHYIINNINLKKVRIYKEDYTKRKSLYKDDWLKE